MFFRLNIYVVLLQGFILMRKADVTLTANFINKKTYTNQKCYLPILKFNDEAHRSQKSRISVQNQHLEQLEK